MNAFRARDARHKNTAAASARGTGAAFWFFWLSRNSHAVNQRQMQLSESLFQLQIGRRGHLFLSLQRLTHPGVLDFFSLSGSLFWNCLP